MKHWSDSEVTRHLAMLVAEKVVAKHRTRKTVGESPRSVLLGLYTKRGLGVGKETWKRLQLLAAIHEWAARRPPPHADHGYVSIMLNCNDSLPRHRDEYNFGVNYVYALEVPGEGGQLWLLLDDQEMPLRVHTPTEFPTDRDWQVLPDPRTDLCSGRALQVATAADAGLCSVESEQGGVRFSHSTLGAICPSIGVWQAFDSRRAHGVLPFVGKDESTMRVSLTPFSPRRLHALPPRMWGALADLGFPCADVQRASELFLAAPLVGHQSTPDAVQASALENAEETTTSQTVDSPVQSPHSTVPRRSKRNGSVLRALTTAAVLHHGNAQSLDGCWLRALSGPSTTTFECFFLDALERGACMPPPPHKRVSHQRVHHGLYPCGLPFWSCYDRSQCSPPQSGRRLQRWRKKFRIRLMVNAAVAYMSWLSLGRPGEWSSRDQHPLLVMLTEKQTKMCTGLLSTSSCVPPE
eukprot:5856312-Amphidinium_carterae.2